MKELLEIRIRDGQVSDAYLESLFQPGELVRNTSDIVKSTIWVAKVKSPGGRLAALSALGPIVNTAFLRREYSRTELEQAELLRVNLKPSAILNDVATEYYDTSGCCPACGLGRHQNRDLVLPLNRIPKRFGIAAVLSGEILIQQDKVALLKELGISGFELRPVRYHSSKWTKAGLQSGPAGRALLKLAGVAGVDVESIFANPSDEVRRLAEKAQDEEDERAVQIQPRTQWRQLLPKGRVSLIEEDMHVGEFPWKRDPQRERELTKHALKAFKPVLPGGVPECGHVLGWDIQSETVVDRASWSGSDLCASEQVHLWHGENWCYPRPVVMASPRFCRVFGDLKTGPFRLEVVKLRGRL